MAHIFWPLMRCPLHHLVNWIVALPDWLSLVCGVEIDKFICSSWLLLHILKLSHLSLCPPHHCGDIISLFYFVYFTFSNFGSKIILIFFFFLSLLVQLWLRLPNHNKNWCNRNKISLLDES